jgi:hypothetical protein
MLGLLLLSLLWQLLMRMLPLKLQACAGYDMLLSLELQHRSQQALPLLCSWRFVTTPPLPHLLCMVLQILLVQLQSCCCCGQDMMHSLCGELDICSCRYCGARLNTARLHTNPLGGEEQRGC